MISEAARICSVLEFGEEKLRIPARTENNCGALWKPKKQRAAVKTIVSVRIEPAQTGTTFERLIGLMKRTETTHGKASPDASDPPKILPFDVNEREGSMMDKNRATKKRFSIFCFYSEIRIKAND